MLVRARLGERVRRRAPIAPVAFDRHAVAAAVAAAVGDHEQPFVADTAMRVAEGLAALVACARVGAALALPDAVERALSSVTPLRPLCAGIQCRAPPLFRSANTRRANPYAFSSSARE